MSSIPEDIYREILLRLPVESLLVCKCICKNWYALITSSDFVSTHITVQEKNPILILDNYISNVLYSIGYDSLLASSVCDIIEMDYPFKSDSTSPRLLGVCNGLASLWLSVLDYKYKSEWPISWNTVCFWNPATREYKEIPKSPYAFKLHHISLHAFGYDCKTNDYKLIIGVDARLSEHTTLVQVYTLASNSWKIGKTVPYLFQHDKIPKVLVNGDLHWLGIAQGNLFLLSLDISDESFKEIELPKEFSEKDKDLMSLGELEGCISVLVFSLVNGVKSHIEVWVMLDYGVLESWSKHHAIDYSNSIFTGLEHSRLVRSFENGEILFLSGDGLLLYDPKHGGGRYIKT
ncbi:F-box protein CPR1-like [Papaver somniferum]|uniref:F-box protein CPR1-like n=1 Tax=Papaver somniferum TaxID=3469 RepID=UPI000E6F6E04|nr:F-box protein CPR1-like [Papaver somniferum]